MLNSKKFQLFYIVLLIYALYFDYSSPHARDLQS